MKRLYFIRHGLSENNELGLWSGQLDVPLALEGRRQVEQAGIQAKQQGLYFDAIVSSPLRRAYDTACCIAQEFDYPIDKIITNDLFKERCYGVLQGTEYGELLEKYLLDETAVDKYEGVETTAQLQERAGKAWTFLRSLEQDSILLACHTAFGRALRRTILGKSQDDIVDSFKNAEIERIF